MNAVQGSDWLRRARVIVQYRRHLFLLVEKGCTLVPSEIKTYQLHLSRNCREKNVNINF